MIDSTRNAAALRSMHLVGFISHLPAHTLREETRAAVARACSPVDRRDVLKRCVGSAIFGVTAAWFGKGADPKKAIAGAPPMRTVLDEERELRQAANARRLEEKREGVKKGFSAVREGARQLDEIKELLTGEADDFKQVRSAARLFNNFERRELMDKLTILLVEPYRTRAKSSCEALTDALQSLDKAAKKRDLEQCQTALDAAREAIDDFLLLEGDGVASVAL